MSDYNWLDLQLFAGEGAGDGGGDGAASGDTAVDAGQQRLLELGVPADKIRKRAKKPVVAPVESVAKAETPNSNTQVETSQDAAADHPAEENQTDSQAVSRMSWDEVKADPEYNQKIQEIVQSRLKSAKGAEEMLAKLAPVLEAVGMKHGIDTTDVSKLDVESLIRAVSEDPSYFQNKADEMGTTPEMARDMNELARLRKEKADREQQDIMQQKIQQHFQKMEMQGQELKKIFPYFDLKKELQNPAFARMTAPNVGISVQDAYYAVHRAEIQEASMRATAQKTAQKLSNSIQANARRPVENGSSSQAPSVITFDFRKASREQREALKKRIFDAAARGEKLYPGR